MKKYLSMALVLAMACTVPFHGGVEVKAAEGYEYPKMEIVLAHSDPTSEQSTYHLFALHFAEEVEKATEGNVEIVIQGNAVLGSEDDYYTALQTGAIEMALFASNGLSSRDVEHTGFFDQPFIFMDDAEANAFMESDVNKEIADNYPASFGIRVLAWGQGGFRNTAEKVRPITSIADYSGLKLRMPPTPAFTNTFSSLGANPTTLAYAECFTAISQGVLDGILLPTGSVYSGNFYEVCNYMVQDRVFYNALALAVSEIYWQGFDPEVQQMLLDCAQAASEREEADAAKMEAEQFKDMEENHGMTITYAEDLDTTGFKEACAQVYEDCRNTIGEELYDKQMAWLEEYRSNK